MLVLIAAGLDQLGHNVLDVKFFERGNVAHLSGDRITDPEAIESDD
jgi:hypothetical protein